MAKTQKEQDVDLDKAIEIKKKISSEEEISFILFKTDERSSSKGNDEVLDEVVESNRLVNNTKFPNLIGKLNTYKRTFEPEFYQQIFKLKGWRVDPDKGIFKKPGIVAKITAYLIYLRFPVGVLQELQQLNKKDEDGERLFKHFQWLTDEGQLLLLTYIEEATELMKKHKTWNEFIKDFTLKYSNPYNLRWDNY